MRVEIVYAWPERQVLETLELPPGARVREALENARVRDRFPEVDVAADGVGVFGRRVSLDEVLKEGDRVELYRPLELDPKERRRRLARARCKEE
jgi:putative ubiquitin-RnfH superfamily antitoxin RatB of RatAB toxin-antitoxin module